MYVDIVPFLDSGTTDRDCNEGDGPSQMSEAIFEILKNNFIFFLFFVSRVIDSSMKNFKAFFRWLYVGKIKIVLIV